MKKILVAGILAFLALGCGSNNEGKTDDIIATKELNKIKEQRKLIHDEYEIIATELAKLDAAINELSGEKNIVLVKANAIKKEAFTHYIEIIGDLDTKENILINPETNGILTKLNVKAGQKVSKGQVLAVIDDGGIAAQLDQSKTQLVLSKTTFERQQNLWNQKIGSEMQYLQAKADFEAKGKAVSQMESMLQKTIVRAPFSGTVEDITVERGQVVSVGMPLMRIINVSNMYVQAQVPETFISKIKMNAPVEVTIASLGKTFVGKVRQIDNYIKPNNRSFGIEVALNNEENLLRPNQTAVLKVEDYVNKDAILVPTNAVIETSNKQYVAFVTGKTNNKKETVVTRKEVTIGTSTADKIEVLSGLTEGEKIVTEGVRSLKDNMTVRVVE